MLVFQPFNLMIQIADWEDYSVFWDIDKFKRDQLEKDIWRNEV